MKMNKIFAAGIAATLAVTSLASVASAEVAREFDMKYSVGVWVYDAQVSGAKSEQLGDKFKFVTPLTPGTIDTYAVDTLVRGTTTATADTNRDGTVDYNDYAGFIPLSVTSASIPLEAMGDLTITVEGRKYDNGNLVNRTQQIKLVKVNSITGTGIAAGANYLLPIYEGTSPVDAFLPEEFSAVDKISVSTGTLKSIVINGLTYNGYKYIYDLVAAGNAPTLKASTAETWYNIQTKGTANWWEGDGWKSTHVDIYGAANATLSIALAASDPLATELCYQVTGTAGTSSAVDITGTPIAFDGVVANGTGVKAGGQLIKEINTLVRGGLTATWKAASSGLVYDDVAWLPNTDDGLWDDIIYRWEVERLSDTNDYTSEQLWGSNYNIDADQTYTVTDYNKGTGPVGFAGLASQVADFFNHQTNGKITFHFTAKETGNNGLAWNNGGIPSTEVGLRNFLDAAKAKDFALFVNYKATTGSLQSDAVLDPYSASVTFDISGTLQALGGQTIGTVQDIYYALTNGASYNNNVLGLYVDKVVLSYDENAKADTAAAADDEKEDTVKEEPKADDKAEPAEVEIPDDTEEPDDDATVVIEEPDDAATIVDNTADNTVVVNPGTTAPAAQADENPHTGVALAVVPAALAAAAMMISKKRK